MLTLAARTPVCRAPSKDRPSDRCTAALTGLAGARVDKMLLLIIAQPAKEIPITKITKARSVSLYRGTKYRGDRITQSHALRTAQSTRHLRRSDTCDRADLIAIDISDPGDLTLIE